MIRFKLVVASHGFKVTVVFNNDKKIMTEFNKCLEVFESRYNYKLKRSVRALKFTYGTHIASTGTYGLHKNLLTEFVTHLKQCRVADNEIETLVLDTCGGVKGHLKFTKGVKPKPEQNPIIDFVIAPGSTRVLPLQMGVGKTFISLYSLAMLGIRASLTMGATHVDTWLRDAAWIFTNSTEEIMVIRGSKAFMKLIACAKKNKLRTSIIIFTINTMRDYLSEFENTGQSTYGCNPQDLYTLLEVGVRVTDEAHENLHFNFRHDIETNVNKAIYLSATLRSYDSTTNRMYEIIYPNKWRYNDLAWNSYTVVKAVSYILKQPDRVRCIGPMGYSHTLYENWIIGNEERLDNYLFMISRMVMKFFTDSYQEGQKLLIYMSTIEMCALMAQYLQDDPYTEKYSISAYTGEHEDEVLHTHDIVVSTPIKSGAGKNVERLATVISTVAIDALEKNVQMMGRLRPLDRWYSNTDPLFVYLVCFSIPKHVDYHRKRLSLFQPLVKRIDLLRSMYSV